MTVEDYNFYDFIFQGTLLGETRSEDACSRTAIYKIDRAFKGTSVGDTISICDSGYSGSCGLGPLTTGRSYLIFALETQQKWTSDCFRTTRVPMQTWTEDSVEIIRLKSLTSFGRIFDTLYTNFHADTFFLNKHVLSIDGTTIQEFYDEHGNISAEGKYSNGEPVGYWKYFKNGKVVSEGKYINGKKDSLWIEPFMENSVYIREYKAGEFTYRESRFYDGKLRSTNEPLGNGEKWIKYDYHHNGQAIYSTHNPQRNDKGN